jgi:hypothetical protein
MHFTRQWKRRRRMLDVYRCDGCGGWHIGNRRATGSPMKKRRR